MKTNIIKPVKSIGILIIEGNANLRSLLGWHLQQTGYNVTQASNLHTAKALFEQQKPVVTVLDSDLPDGDGVEFCRWLHRQDQSLILMLSAKITELDIVTGLRAGADDYLRKPFGMQEFLARLEALTRRSRLLTAPISLEYGDLKIDLVQRSVCFQNHQIELTPQEFSLLYVLTQANGEALSRSDLLRRAWPNAIDNPRTIDTHILSLRKKIEIDPRQPSLIQTIRNVGYRFNPELLHHSQASSQSGNKAILPKVQHS